MKFDRDIFHLSSGRWFYAYDGILGVERDPDDGRLRATYGHDGHVKLDDPDADKPLTPEERQEIAEFMTDLWRRWAAQP
jgi:hypothetical protein